MWHLSSKQKEAVSKLEPFKRYTYSIKRIADTETIYYLRHNDGTLILAELDGKTVVSIWPHTDFAQELIEKERSLYSVCEVPLKEFTDSLIPSLGPDVLIDVFGVNNRSGFVVSQLELSRDLREELKNY